MDQKLNEDKPEVNTMKIVQKELDSWPDWLIFGVGMATIAGFFLVLSRFVNLCEFLFEINILFWFIIHAFMAPGYLIERMVFGTLGYVGTETGYILLSGLWGLISLFTWFMVGALVGSLKISYRLRFYVLIGIMIFAVSGFMRLIP